MSKNYAFLYFSGTGNTAYVANQLKQKMEAQGATVRLLMADQLWAECGRTPQKEADIQKIKNRLSNFVKDISVLVLLYPTYASEVPIPLKSLLAFFPSTSLIKLAVISTIAEAGGDCCLIPEKILKPLGYKSLMAAYVKMPSNLCVPYLPFKLDNEHKNFYDFRDCFYR